MAVSLWRAIVGGPSTGEDASGGIEFWNNPERSGWLNKQGEYIKTWRRRWFVLKQGKLFWFKESVVTRASVPRGVIPVALCLTVKGAEDVLNRQFAFELSTSNDTMYFIADSEKEKEDWINSIGRSIVQHSRSVVTDNEVLDYDSRPLPSPKTPRIWQSPVLSYKLRSQSQLQVSNGWPPWACIIQWNPHIGDF